MHSANQRCGTRPSRASRTPGLSLRVSRAQKWGPALSDQIHHVAPDRAPRVPTFPHPPSLTDLSTGCGITYRITRTTLDTSADALPLHTPPSPSYRWILSHPVCPVSYASINTQSRLAPSALSCLSYCRPHHHLVVPKIVGQVRSPNSG